MSTDIEIGRVEAGGVGALTARAATRSVFESGLVRIMEWPSYAEAFPGKRMPVPEQVLAWFGVFAEGMMRYADMYFGIYLEMKGVVDFFRSRPANGLTEAESAVRDAAVAQGGMTSTAKGWRTTPGGKCRGVIIVNAELCAEDGVPESAIIKHETSHLLYKENPRYQRRVHSTFKRMSERGRWSTVAALESDGYSDPTREKDEWAAIIVSDARWRLRKKVKLTKADVDLQRQLRQEFEEAQA